MLSRLDGRHLAAITLLTALPSLAGAQALTPEVGLYGGPNRSTMTGIGPAMARVEGQFGVFAAFPISPTIAFRSELGVSRKQVQTVTTEVACPLEMLCTSWVGSQTVERTTFTWLEVPLLVQVTPSRAIVWGLVPRLVAGPFVAVRLGRVACDVTTPPAVPEQPLDSAGTSLLAPCSAEYEPGGSAPARNGDLGFVLGAGARRGRLGVGVRWTRSLVEAVPPSPFGFSRLMGGRHSTLTLTLEVGTTGGR